MPARWLHRLVTLALIFTASSAAAQEQRVRFTLGVAGVAVADAWNPLRLELRDLPSATLTLLIDQGSLRSGEVPLTLTRAVRGGAGITVFEMDLYVPTFTSLSWRLTTTERLVASGSVAGRESDSRPLDLLLTNDPAGYRASHSEVLGGSSRPVEVASAQLPERAAAYDGVRSLIIDGSSAAPRLEAVAAAAAGGAVVALRGELPASHQDILLLLDPSEAVTRLGAGAVLPGAENSTELFQQIATLQVPNRRTLLAAALEKPLVEPPTPLKQAVILLASGALSLLLVVLLRWAGAPGVITALALALLVSLLGWQMLRPSSPQLSGDLSLRLIGGELALALPATETLTLPQARLTSPVAVRPLRLQPYDVDDDGVHLTLERWRTVLLLQAPQLSASQLSWEGDTLHNVGSAPLHDLYRVGAGPIAELLSAGAVLEPEPLKDSAATWPGYEGLLEQLPGGVVLARSSCLAECQVWVLFPRVSPDVGVVPAGVNGATAPSGDAGLANPFAPSGGTP